MIRRFRILRETNVPLSPFAPQKGVLRDFGVGIVSSNRNLLMYQYEITWSGYVDQPWVQVTSCRIGNIPMGLGTPDKYILLTQGEQPVLRVDAYSGSEESFAFEDALVWHDFLVIGWGHHVYLIQIKQRSVITHALNTYFGHLFAHDDYLLVASGERLLRIEFDGSIAWKSELLGIDGVIVGNVENGIIRGSGEWDPPGGWQAFQICLDSGRLDTST